MNILAATTHFQIGIIIDTPRDETLAQMTLLVQSLIELLVILSAGSSETIQKMISLTYLGMTFFKEAEKIIYLLSDIVLAIDYSYRVSSIVFNTLLFLMRG